MEQVLTFDAVSPFSVNLSKLNVLSDSPLRNTSSHIHDGCEIYVNLTGDVSFMVEQNIYAIEHGDIIITKPYEYHHCVYNAAEEHDHYWITFPVAQNEGLLSAFLERENGQGNLIRLPSDRRERFLRLCDRLLTANQTQPVTVLALFLELLRFIEDGSKRYGVGADSEGLPSRLGDILGYMNENFASIGNVTELSDRFHISISTMERYFKTYLDVTPKKYLENKRLSNACRLLHQNATVTQACFDSGFTDYSHFISLFKRNFHTTPLQYKKWEEDNDKQ